MFQSAPVSYSEEDAGLSLEGKLAASCTTTPHHGTPFPPTGIVGGGAGGGVGRGGEGGGSVSAEEMDRRMREHLEGKALEW